MEAKVVRIAMSGHARGEVFINGEKVQGVQSFSVSAGLHEPNRLTLTLLAEAIEVEGEFEVLRARHVQGRPADGA